jgi:hypothetical protein
MVAFWAGTRPLSGFAKVDVEGSNPFSRSTNTTTSRWFGKPACAMYVHFPEVPRSNGVPLCSCRDDASRIADSREAGHHAPNPREGFEPRRAMARIGCNPCHEAGLVSRSQMIRIQHAWDRGVGQRAFDHVA